MNLRISKLMLGASLLLSSNVNADCGTRGVQLQVLGSGGPVADDARASSGYLIWIDGHARLLVDSGGGIFLRFGEAKARIEDLELIALTHFHADHVADLPALVKSSFFTKRIPTLAISGPDGNDEFPGLEEFLAAEFGPKRGAFRYLSGALDGTGGQFKLSPKQLRASGRTSEPVFQSNELSVEAVGVPHGPVPALGYLVRTRGLRVAFSGDQNGTDEAFWKLAAEADMLVMDSAIAENADPVARKLHALPSVIGEQAAAAHVRRLVLSHWMNRSLEKKNENLMIVRARYKGRVDVAQDLSCYRLDGGG